MAYMYGCVEYRLGDEWHTLLDIGNLLNRHMDLQGCLFGVDNVGHFRPLFPDRGLPGDLSYNARQQRAHYPVLSESWVGLGELLAVNWDERAEAPDERVSEYVVLGSGERQLVGKSPPSATTLPAVVRQALEAAPFRSVKLGDRVFTREVLSRSDALACNEFPLLLQLMSCAGSRFGVDHVRMVVWFE